MVINKYSDVPLYCQLKNLIIKKIEKGEYEENAKIPSEQEFCELYSISRPTVRQAISELTNSGYLYKEKGRGTFVSKSKSRIDIKNYTGFTDSIIDSHVPGEKNIIGIKTVRTSDYSKLEEVFQLPYDGKTDFVEVMYTSANNGEVFALNVSYIPLNLFPEIIDDINNKKPSHDILRGKYPLIPMKSKSSIEVIYTEQADARYLEVQPGQPLIKIDNVLYSKGGQTVEYIISKCRCDKCKLIFENSK